MTQGRKLGLEITALVVFLLLTIFLLELRYQRYATGVDKMIAGFESEKKEAEILWLGNSHTLAIVVNRNNYPEQIKSASLAYGGIDLFWMSILLQKYILELPKLKMIYLGLDQDLLGYNQSVFNVEYGNRSFYRYTDTLYKDTPMDRLLASSNFFRSNRDLSFLFRGPEEADFKVYEELNNNVFRANPEFCLQRAKEQTEIRFSSDLLKENTILLSKIFSTVKNQNIPLTVFMPPKSACYLEYCNKTNLSNAYALIDSLTRKFGLPVYDMNKAEVFPDSLFRDPDHLNKNGALEAIRKIYAHSVEEKYERIIFE